MYLVEATGRLLRRRGARGERRTGVGRNVVLLGLTSLLTDVSAEMVATVLPLYLVYGLGASPLAYGVVDGIYQGASALTRLISGFVADRSRRHKEVATAGYALGAASKAGLVIAGGATGPIAALVFVDRIGKGIRTAPRDALISLSVPAERLGRAFGVHRAMDTVGAMMGPLIAFSILLAAPSGYDAVFIVSTCFALLGLGVLTTFVENRAERVAAEPVSLRAAAGLLALPGFRRLVIAGALLSVVTISDAFLYLGLQRRIDFEPAVFPLLFVGTAAAYTLLAIPMGRLADRVGRTRVFLAGYAALGLVYAALLAPSLGVLALIGCLVALGAWYAATDGVLMALASALAPEHLRASALGLLVTVTSLGRLVAAVTFGAVWTAWGLHSALLAFGIALMLGLAAAVLVLGRRLAHA